MRFTRRQTLALLPTAILTAATSRADSPSVRHVQLSSNATGWAQNSVNAVTFRTCPLATHGRSQFTAFYNGSSEVIIGRRELGTSEWTLNNTGLTGNTKDAHNAISIAADGRGFLHMAWDHHGHELNYVKSTEPHGLVFGERLTMTGLDEDRVTYPEFFNLDDGGLLFLYRQGSSGNGRTMLNRYCADTRRWRPVVHPLIDGEGLRNGYTNQIAIDNSGAWHISWCWRETGGVETNHDICYAVTRNEGRTWERSDGVPFRLPITAGNAEYVKRIPQNSELINQTSMTTDRDGRPLIATYFRPEGSDIPQYHIVWHDGAEWQTTQAGKRKTPFTLSGGGTKRIPISRPKVLADRRGKTIMLFRDEERGMKASAAVTDSLADGRWNIIDLTSESLGLWEPSYDMNLWKRDGVVHLFVQYVGQGDGETTENVPPQPISVCEWRP